MPATGLRPRPRLAGRPPGARSGPGCALPFALQARTSSASPLAAREGVGAVTSFGYAYLIGSARRRGDGGVARARHVGAVDALRARLSRVARHVVSSSWLALVGSRSSRRACSSSPVGDRLGRPRGGYAATSGRSSAGSSCCWRRGWSLDRRVRGVSARLHRRRRERPLARLRRARSSRSTFPAAVGRPGGRGLSGLALALAVTTHLASRRDARRPPTPLRATLGGLRRLPARSGVIGDRRVRVRATRAASRGSAALPGSLVFVRAPGRRRSARKGSSTRGAISARFGRQPASVRHGRLPRPLLACAERSDASSDPSP